MDRISALFVALVVAMPVLAAEEPGPPPAATKPVEGGKPAEAASAPTQAVEMMVGEVITLPYNRSSAYGPGRVRGPAVNLTDAGNGEWKGNIKDLNGVFKVTETRISGANLNMVMDRDGEEWTCQGTVDGKRVRIVLSPDGLVARYDNRLYDLKRVAPDLWATVPSGPAIRVKGDAAGRSPYYPQFIFALLTVL